MLAHRRLLAAVCALLAVLIGTQAVRPAAPPRATMTVVSHDLPAGTRLSSTDLTTVRIPPGTVPDGSEGVDDLDGRVLASAIRRGEPVTDRRLVGPALVADTPGLVAVPVRLPDAEMARLLRVGDVVRLLATDVTHGITRVVAPAAHVLALPDDAAGAGASPTAADGVAGAPGGRLIVVGIPDELVATVTAASARDFLTFAYAH